jgi:hypothetical protein
LARRWGCDEWWTVGHYRSCCLNPLLFRGSCQSWALDGFGAVFRRNHRRRGDRLRAARLAVRVGLAERWPGLACQVARAGSVTQTERTIDLAGEEVWRERGRVGDRPGPAGAGWSVRPCPTPTTPGSSRNWTRRWPRPGRPGICGPSARSWRRGIESCSSASTAVNSERRPRRGCAGAKSLSGRANRWRWTTRSAVTSHEPFPKSARRACSGAGDAVRVGVLGRCSSDRVSSSVLDADGCSMCRFLHQLYSDNFCVQLQ